MGRKSGNSVSDEIGQSRKANGSRKASGQEARISKKSAGNAGHAIRSAIGGWTAFESPGQADGSQKAPLLWRPELSTDGCGQAGPAGLACTPRGEAHGLQYCCGSCAGRRVSARQRPGLFVFRSLHGETDQKSIHPPAVKLVERTVSARMGPDQVDDRLERNVNGQSGRQ